MKAGEWDTEFPAAVAALPRKKDGEKAELLKACGQMVFRCEGDILTTQGIYCSACGRKAECFCKRAVWVPRVFNLNDLRDMFASFGAELSCDVTSETVVGVCGLSPTRTAHASDTTFLVLAQFVKKKFAVIASVSVSVVRNSEDEPPSYDLKGISSGEDCVADVVNWVKEESSVHRTTAVKKRGKYKKHRRSSSDGSGDLDYNPEDLESPLDSPELCETPKKRRRRVKIDKPLDSPRTPEIRRSDVHTIWGTPYELSSSGPTPDVNLSVSDAQPEPEIISVPPVVPFHHQEAFCMFDGFTDRPVSPVERNGLFCQSPFYGQPTTSPSVLYPESVLSSWPSTNSLL